MENVICDCDCGCDFVLYGREIDRGRCDLCELMNWHEDAKVRE